MRARLVESVMQVCAQKRHLPFVIDDVIAAAGVSRGTFYKYFTSLDELIASVGDELAEAFTRESIAIAGNIERPMLRTAIGVRRLLEQAADDPTWAAFVSRMSFAGNDGFVLAFAVSEYAHGKAIGEYAFDDSAAVGDVTLGAIIAAIRRISAGGGDDAYISAVSLHILLSLGAEAQAARQAVADAAAFCRHGATGNLGLAG